MGLPGMGPMSKKARGRQMQQQAARGKGKKGKGGKAKGAPARRPMGGPAGLPGLPGGLPATPGALPGGFPGLPPGQQLPDLTKLRFDSPGDERPGR
jgi:signal recognition particle subunit SRP54